MDEKGLAYSKLEISRKIKNKKNYFNEITFGRKSLTLTTVRPSLQLRRRMDEKGLAGPSQGLKIRGGDACTQSRMGHYFFSYLLT